MNSFQRDLDENLDAITSAREAVLRELGQLRDEDLAATRRGSWSVREVLHHLIDSEVAYAKVVAFLRSTPIDLANARDDDTASPGAAAAALARVRAQLLELVEGIDEKTFYDLRALGKEQYSVVSVLENVASHDHEHVQQIAKTVASSRVD
jgi:uncharacterized damage-inducible protein DinB